jgi:hypothetical protein
MLAISHRKTFSDPSAPKCPTATGLKNAANLYRPRPPWRIAAKPAAPFPRDAPRSVANKTLIAV